MSKKFDAGVKEYRDYLLTPAMFPSTTDLLACFKVTGQTCSRGRKWQPQVQPILHRHLGPRSLVRAPHRPRFLTKAVAYRIEDVPGDKESVLTPSCLPP